MKHPKEIFLGKGGLAHGPFTATELEEFRASGRIDGYRWIWDDEKELWKPLDPPPAPLSGKSAGRGSSASARIDLAALEILCHDGRSLLSGRVGGLTETGCDVVAEDGPAFGPESRVALNLLDPSSGRSITVAAKLARISREDGLWVYRFRWETSPLEQLVA